MKKTRLIELAQLACILIIVGLGIYAANAHTPESSESTLILEFESYGRFESTSYSLIKKGWHIQHLTNFGDSGHTNDRHLVAVYTKNNP